MKVSQNNPIPPPGTSPVRPEKAGQSVSNAPEKVARESKADVKPAPSPEGVPVSVSRMASNMVQARQAAPADIDQKKVDLVRTSIEKRTFKANPEVIADKMLSNAEEILRRKLN